MHGTLYAVGVSLILYFMMQTVSCGTCVKDLLSTMATPATSLFDPQHDKELV